MRIFYKKSLNLNLGFILLLFFYIRLGVNFFAKKKPRSELQGLFVVSYFIVLITPSTP